MLLSAALIVKNEERYLADCLRSIKNLVDEVVVVDTGSTDSTLEIAAAFGCRVFHFPWSQDFSAARNFGLDRVRGEWVLYIDADEQVRPVDPTSLRELLKNSECAAGTVLLHPRADFTPYWILRVFRNHPLVRFQGVIHENIWPGVLAYQEAHGGQVCRTPLIVDHKGYTGDQGSKHERNLPMLQRELERAPQRIFCWNHLGDVQMALGHEAEAVAAWKAAIEIARKKSVLLPDDSLPYHRLITFEMDRKGDASEWADEARRLFPDDLQLIWLSARVAMTAGKFAEALALLEALLARARAGNFEQTMAYDQRIVGALAQEAIANCHFRLGRYADSRRAYEAALALEPKRLEYRVKAALCSQLERK